MNKNSTKSHKNKEINKNLKTQLDKYPSNKYPSKKTLDFILSYSKSTKSLLGNKFIVSLN